MSAAAAADRPNAKLSQLLGAVLVQCGAARLMIVVPLYVVLGAAALIPLGLALFLGAPVSPGASIFDSFIGDYLAAPQGILQRAVNMFYLCLYVISYLSIASVLGYEERRDRSIMFMKSLPIADGVWVLGQILMLPLAFAIGWCFLLGVNAVITVWESAYFAGLNQLDSSLGANLARMLGDMLGYGASSLMVIVLSLPFGISMLWFSTFTRRQPGGLWLSCFLSLYLVAFFLRYIDIDFIWPILWYPDNFVAVATDLIANRQLPQLEQPFGVMLGVCLGSSALFAFLTWRSRKRAMPVA